jgi:hypothetical protein
MALPATPWSLVHDEAKDFALLAAIGADIDHLHGLQHVPAFAKMLLPSGAVDRPEDWIAFVFDVEATMPEGSIAEVLLQRERGFQRCTVGGEMLLSFYDYSELELLAPGDGALFIAEVVERLDGTQYLLKNAIDEVPTKYSQAATYAINVIEHIWLGALTPQERAIFWFTLPEYAGDPASMLKVGLEFGILRTEEELVFITPPPAPTVVEEKLGAQDFV